MNYHKQPHNIHKYQNYNNICHDSGINYENNAHFRSYSDNFMPCKRRLYTDETYGMHHAKIHKDHSKYIQVISTLGHGGTREEKQLYYNNYQIKIPEFTDKNNPGRKPYLNVMKDASYWDRKYIYPPYFQNATNRSEYNRCMDSMWTFSDTHLPYRRPNPRHFGSAEYLNRKAAFAEQITLHDRDAPCHRYPLAEPNDMPWGIPTRKIRNNISMPNIALQFRGYNNMNHTYRHQNMVEPLNHKTSFTNFSIPIAAIKRTIFNMKPTDLSNEDSISLFCDDSFSSSEYRNKEIESPRVILSRSINNINKLAPHSVTENLYISNDIEIIDTGDGISSHNNEKKSKEKCKHNKNENSINNHLTNSHQKKKKKCKNSFDGLNYIYKHGIDKENIQKYKEKIKKSFSHSNESLIHKKDTLNQKSMLLNTIDTQKFSTYKKNNDVNWPLNTYNENKYHNFIQKNNQKLSKHCNTELNTLQTHNIEFTSNVKPNNEQKIKLYSLPQEKSEFNNLNDDKSDIVSENQKLNRKKTSDFKNNLKQAELPIFSQFSSTNNTNDFQKTSKKSLNTSNSLHSECKLSNQTSSQELNKKITFSDFKNMQNQEYCINDPETQLKYAKKLIQVASELSNDNLKDTKFIKKNKEKYLSDAYSIVKGLVNSNPPYPEAMFFLANCYGDGTLGLSVDHKQAYMLYYSASKYKHSQSIYRTAVCLEIGMGIKKNQEKAVQYYQKAASLGNVTAMYKIGIILLNGLLKQTKNPKKAIFWLKKASELADEENPHALHELAILHEKDNGGVVTRNEEYSLELYTKAAHLMYPPSQARLAYAYEHGILGCEIDPKKSISWYMLAAEKGNPDAELGLSGWYLTGAEGILEQSDKKAYLWAKKAAEKGFTKAEYVIGYYLEVGIGVKSNRVEAKIWYKRAAKKGLVRAIEKLYELKKSGSNSKIPDKMYSRWQLAKMFDSGIL
ncbi:hypothetical protein PCANB_001815 [Pneumocystis canis]|nr:hypothetical protein PCK1_002024 [Pneumocystis canis]KAG5440245.1 hypothetical protein PCANB_001815 [Pneumocystis canis]